MAGEKKEFLQDESSGLPCKKGAYLYHTYDRREYKVGTSLEYTPDLPPHLQKIEKLGF